MNTFTFKKDKEELNLTNNININNKVNKIYFEEGIKFIYSTNKDFFYNIDSLDEVYLPNSIKYIDETFFDSLHKQTIVFYKDNKDFVIINNELMYSNLKRDVEEIIIPSDVKTIASGVFRCYSNLRNIVLPKGLKVLGDNVFSMCDSLNDVFIPSSVELIGSECFSECISLINLTVDQDNKHYTATEGFLFTKDLTEILYSQKERHSVFLPTELKSINAFTFKLNTLKDITLPSNLLSIGEYAFFNCKSLTHVNIDKSTQINFQTDSYIGQSAFALCTNLESITIPSNIKTIKFEAFLLCENLKSIIITEGVTTLEDQVFKDCTKLESITLPKSLNKIGENIFNGCINLRNISIDIENEFFTVNNNKICNK
ncbi:MAG: leucine-rich repeat domain-containing protein [bacterium]